MYDVQRKQKNFPEIGLLDLNFFYENHNDNSFKISTDFIKSLSEKGGVGCDKLKRFPYRLLPINTDIILWKVKLLK